MQNALANSVDPDQTRQNAITYLLIYLFILQKESLLFIANSEEYVSALLRLIMVYTVC